MKYRWIGTLQALLAVAIVLPSPFAHAGRVRELVEGLKNHRSFESVLDQAYNSIESHRRAKKDSDAVAEADNE